MNNFELTFLLALLLSITNLGIANAGIYKWVDKDGSVHFTDKPPEENNATAMNIKSEQVASSSSSIVKSNTKQVPNLKPLPHIAGAAVNTVSLVKVVLSLNTDSNSDVAIGKSYANCTGSAPTTPYNNYTNDRDLYAPDEGLLNNKGYYKQFSKVFKDNHYNVSTPKTELFATEDTASVDLLVGAIVKKLSVNMCRDGDTMTVASYVEITWQVYDPLNREVVYETTTEGSDIKDIDGHNAEEIKQTDARSFGNATNNLLAKPDFFKILLKGNEGDQTVESEPVSLKLMYGNGTGDFVSNVEQLKSATVTVRTTTGHGSGLIVSSDGYVITNAHVVGHSTDVLVIIDKKKYRAKVVKENYVRDVALLKMDMLGKVSPLRISRHKIGTGEPVYVIGTPLDENLSHTVTRGILSAERVMNGKRYYQTDASVNPGNSGGPAFNAKGEVIGITVAGIFAKDGGSLNINFLIPVDDALTSLGIDNHVTAGF